MQEPKGDGNFKWYAAEAEDSEAYEGGFATREEALALGQHVFGDEPYVLLECDKRVPDFNFFRADAVLETFDEHNMECWGEDGPEIAASEEETQQLERALAAAFGRWLDDNKLHPHVFMTANCRTCEYINWPEAALDADTGEGGAA